MLFARTYKIKLEKKYKNIIVKIDSFSLVINYIFMKFYLLKKWTLNL